MSLPTLGDIALRVGGEVQGNGSLAINGLAAIHRAGPHDLTFVGDEKNLRLLAQSRAGACLVSHKHRGSRFLAQVTAGLIYVDDPQDAFITLMGEFRPERPGPKVGISPQATISPSAVIGADCQIFPGVYVDDDAVVGSRCVLYPGVYVGRSCRIGDDCTLHPHVVLYADVSLGKRVVVHASAVIGADGFGYRFRKGRFEKTPQRGSVEIGDDCEIGACTTIDRGMIGATIVGEGTKLDNLVMIGHNCELGKHNAFASQVGLAGSVTTGDYVRCAGQVGIADHLHLGTGSTLGAKSGVHTDIPEGATYIGLPARPEQEQYRISMIEGKLPEMRRTLRDLESRVEELSRLVEQAANQSAET